MTENTSKTDSRLFLYEVLVGYDEDGGEILLHTAARNSKRSREIVRQHLGTGYENMTVTRPRDDFEFISQEEMEEVEAERDGLVELDENDAYWIEQTRKTAHRPHRDVTADTTS